MTTSPCQEFQSTHEGDFVVIFDADARSSSSPSDHRYPKQKVFVCVDNPDLRYRYSVNTTFEDLPPDPGIAPIGDLLKKAKLTSPENSPFDTFLGEVPPSTPNPGKLVDETEAFIGQIRKPLDELTGSKPISQDRARKLATDLTATLGDRAISLEELRAVQPTANDALDTAQKKTPPDPKEVAAAKNVKDAIDRLIQELPIWLANADLASRHLSKNSPPIFQISPMDGKAVTLSIRGEKLTLSQESPPKLSYSDPQEVGTSKFESRSLSYARVGLGLVYSELHDRTYRVGPNEIGAPVIQFSDTSSLLPVLFFTHYWAGADTREPSTPWNKRTPWWGANFLPTLTVGIPLTRSPLENIFVGGTIQFVPGIAMTYGAHIGRVTRLRPDFTTDTAPPAGTNFRIEDATAPRWAVGQYFGVVITDALFVGVIEKLVK